MPMGMVDPLFYEQARMRPRYGGHRLNGRRL
jgi:hypothetical protein